MRHEFYRHCTEKTWLGRTVYGAGLLAPIFSLGGAAFAALFFSPSYSILNRDISELGNSGHSSSAHWFNLGMMAGAVLLAVFIVGASLYANKKSGYVVAAFGLASTIGMFLVGTFPAESATMRYHNIAAGVAFLGMLLMCGSFSIFILIAEQEIFPKWLFVPSTLSVITILVFVLILAGKEGGMLHDSIHIWRDVNERATIRLSSAFEWFSYLSVLLWSTLTTLALRKSIRQNRVS